MKSVLKQILTYSSKSRFSIRSLGYLPRWVILFIDLFVIFMSGFLTYFLFKGIGLQYFKSHNEVYKILLFFTTNLFFFWWFKTYSGIIRHSSFIDAIKIFFAQVSSFIFLVLCNVIFSVYFKHSLFITTALLIHIIVSFCILFLYRVLVKQFFEIYLKGIQSEKTVKAIGFYHRQ